MIRFSILFIFWSDLIRSVKISIFLSKWIRSVQNGSKRIKLDQIWFLMKQSLKYIIRFSILFIFWSDWIRSVQNCQYNQICNFYQFHLFQFSKSSIISITFDKFCHFYIFNYHVLLFYIVHDLFNLFNQFYILVFKIIFNLPILIFNNQATRAQD